MKFSVGQKVYVCWGKFIKTLKGKPNSPYGHVGEIVSVIGEEEYRSADGRSLPKYFVKFKAYDRYSYFEDHLVAASDLNV